MLGGNDILGAVIMPRYFCILKLFKTNIGTRKIRHWWKNSCVLNLSILYFLWYRLGNLCSWFCWPLQHFCSWVKCQWITAGSGAAGAALGECSTYFAIALLFAGIASTTTAGMWVLLFSGMFVQNLTIWRMIFTCWFAAAAFVPAVIVFIFHLMIPSEGIDRPNQILLLSVQLPLTVFMQIWLIFAKVMGTYANKPFIKVCFMHWDLLLQLASICIFYMLVLQ